MEKIPSKPAPLHIPFFWIILVLGFLFCIEVIETTEKFVKAVNSGEELVAVAQMVFAKLAGGIAEGLQQFGHGGIFLLKSLRGTRQTGPGRFVMLTCFV
jgi:hypothetical protein